MLGSLNFSYRPSLLNSRLSRTLILWILLISGLFSLLSIGFQLSSEYDYEKSRLQNSAREIAYSYADLINLQLVELNEPALQRTLDSMVNFESIAYARLLTEVDGQINAIKMESGRSNAKLKPSGFALTISDGSNNFGKPVTLELTIDDDVAERKVIDKLIIIGWSQGPKIFILACFILLFIHFKVIRHIHQVSGWLEQYNPKHQFIPMKNAPGRSNRNEMEELKSAVSKMGRQMHEYAVSMESVVSQRTEELKKRTEELELTQQELHRVLWEKEQKLKGVSEAINDWLWDLDRFGNIVSLSTELATLIDFTVKNDEPQQLIIELPFAADTTTAAAKDKIKQAISERRSFEAVQASLKKKDGGLIWVRLSASPYFSKAGEFLGYHGSATDITQNVQLEQLAYTDSLTGIANRVAFFHRVEKEMQRAKRLSYEIGVMMLDLDYFKRINDNYGHDAGDEVLRRTAQAMALCLREQDCIGRIGGEEFAVIIPGADKLGLENVAVRLRQALAPLRFPFMADDAEVTISIGFTIVRSGETFKKALNRADQHLYRAKANGRNCYVTDDEGYTDFVI